MARPSYSCPPQDAVTLHEAVLKHLPIDPRRGYRILNALQAPRSVQNAYDAGRLSLNTVEAAARLSAAATAALKERVKGGEDVVAVVQDLLPKRAPRPRQKASAALRAVVRAVVRACQDVCRELNGREALARRLDTAGVATLREAAGVLQRAAAAAGP